MPEPPANRVQMELLVNYMKKNTDMAKGIITKAHSKHRWEEIANALNNKGPPIKDWQKWNRVWINYKAKAKVKLTENRFEYRASLKNVMEEILEFRNPVTPPAEVFENANDDVEQKNIQEIKSENEYDTSTSKADFSNSVWQDAFEINFQEIPSQNVQSDNDNFDTNTLNREASKRKSESNKKYILSDIQAEGQDKLYEVLLKHASIEKSLKELVELKKEELNILKKEIKQKEIYRQQKLSLLNLQSKEN